MTVRIRVTILTPFIGGSNRRIDVPVAHRVVIINVTLVQLVTVIALVGGKTRRMPGVVRLDVSAQLILAETRNGPIVTSTSL